MLQSLFVVYNPGICWPCNKYIKLDRMNSREWCYKEWWHSHKCSWKYHWPSERPPHLQVMEVTSSFPPTGTYCVLLPVQPIELQQPVKSAYSASSLKKPIISMYLLWSHKDFKDKSMSDGEGMDGKQAVSLRENDCTLSDSLKNQLVDDGCACWNVWRVSYAWVDKRADKWMEPDGLKHRVGDGASGMKPEN